MLIIGRYDGCHLLTIDHQEMRPAIEGGSPQESGAGNICQCAGPASIVADVNEIVTHRQVVQFNPPAPSG
jgi:hypothetical protein